jgi:hypothetical protein
MKAGIDPGFAGAIAILDGDNTLVNVYDMPVIDIGKKKELDGQEIISILKENEVKYVNIEKAQTMPGQGIVSAGNYLKNYGYILGILCALKIPYQEIHPATWKKKMLSDMPKEKEASILKCKQLYPEWRFERKKDHGICDAILIASLP